MNNSPSPENLADAPPPVRVKRNGWRPRFGLRTLLVAMLLLGGVGGIAARWIDWHNRQQAMKLLIADDFDLTFAPVTEPLDLPGWPTPEPPQTWDRVVAVENRPWTNITPSTLDAVFLLSNLQELSIANHGGVPLPSFAGMRSLRELKIFDASLKPGEATRIADCPILESLSIEVDVPSSKELGALDRLKHLRSLHIEGPLDDDVVASWRFSPGLETLHLSNARELSGKALAELIRHNPSLRSVDLPEAECSIEVCQALRECKSLKKLLLRDGKLDDEGLAELSALDQLAILDITGSYVTGSAFEREGSFPALIELDATDSEIDDSGAFYLAQLPQLRNLSLRRTKVTDTACEHLGRSELTTLDLGLNEITVYGADKLNRERLEELKLEGTKVNLVIFSGPEPWPKLKLLTINDPPRASAEWLELDKIPNLERAGVDTLPGRGAEPCKHLRLIFSLPGKTPKDDASQELYKP
jgi:Leucine-rich repeat (LRR) protein